ncbi:MAG: peptidoglycan-binding protein [Acetobacteraceae bacterium]|nr:peptidoglycan-binding protein [Acetobacteraceae bacterium]
MNWKLAGAAAMALAVAACGTEPGERTSGGAAAGAATGAGIGALGGPVGALAGAAIGAGAGAATGAATSPSQVNLGEPPWSNPDTRVPGVREGRTGRQYSSNSRYYGSSGRYGSRTVHDAQQALQQRGFNPGPIDGRWGPQTANAVEDFQRANNMQVTGRLDSQVLQALNVSQGGASTQTGSSDRNRAYMGGGMVGTPSDAGTPSTGPGGTSNVGSGNQPGTGGTTQTR